MNVMIARFYRWLYLIAIGRFRGEISVDIFDHRGAVEIASGTPSGDQRRIWWKRIDIWRP